jgi:radical SAM protein with 4Fe4S-binding SPASM domain
MNKEMDELETKIRSVKAGDESELAGRFANIKTAMRNHSLLALSIEPTSRCNLKCDFCFLHSRQAHSIKEKKDMDMTVFNEIIEKTKVLDRLKVVYLVGYGEPLLNPNIVEMVKITKTANIADQILIATNGVFLTGDKFKQLAEAGLSRIKVSLDTFTPEKFRELKGADVGRTVVKNLETCIELVRTDDLGISLSIMCTPLDDSELGGETRKIINHFWPLIQDLPDVMLEYRDLISWNDPISRLSAKGDKEYNRSVPCEYPFYYFLVHFDGDISMCCADVTKKLVVGNIRKIKDMNEVLTSEVLKNTRKNLLLLNFNALPACKHCAVPSIVNSTLLKRRDELLPLLT